MDKAVLYAKLGDKDLLVRMDAVNELCAFPQHQELLPELMQIYKATPDELVRATICDALYCFDHSVVPFLIEALYEDDPVYNLALTSLLAHFAKSPNEIERIIRVRLNDTNPRVRAAAAYILEERVGVEKISCLWDILRYQIRGGDKYEYELVVRALKKMEKSAVPILLKTVREEEEWLRRAAIDALGFIGDAAAVPVLIEALYDEDSEIGHEAALALANIKTQEAVKALIEAFRENEEMRHRVFHLVTSELAYHLCIPEAIAAVEQWERQRQNPPIS
jgi:HEAT repeat protein